MSQTRTLARYLVTSRIEDIPDDVRHEARRSLVKLLQLCWRIDELDDTGELLSAAVPE